MLTVNSSSSSSPDSPKISAIIFLQQANGQIKGGAIRKQERQQKGSVRDTVGGSNQRDGKRGESERHAGRGKLELVE